MHYQLMTEQDQKTLGPHGCVDDWTRGTKGFICTAKYMRDLLYELFDQRETAKLCTVHTRVMIYEGVTVDGWSSGDGIDIASLDMHGYKFLINVAWSQQLTYFDWMVRMATLLTQSVGDPWFIVNGHCDPKIPHVLISIVKHLCPHGLVPNSDTVIVGINNLRALRNQIDSVLYITEPICKNCKNHRNSTRCLSFADDCTGCPASNEAGSITRFDPKER